MHVPKAIILLNNTWQQQQKKMKKIEVNFSYQRRSDSQIVGPKISFHLIYINNCLARKVLFIRIQGKNSIESALKLESKIFGVSLIQPTGNQPFVPDSIAIIRFVLRFNSVCCFFLLRLSQFHLAWIARTANNIRLQKKQNNVKSFAYLRFTFTYFISRVLKDLHKSNGVFFFFFFFSVSRFVY